MSCYKVIASWTVCLAATVKWLQPQINSYHLSSQQQFCWTTEPEPAVCNYIWSVWWRSMAKLAAKTAITCMLSTWKPPLNVINCKVALICVSKTEICVKGSWHISETHKTRDNKRGFLFFVCGGVQMDSWYQNWPLVSLSVQTLIFHRILITLFWIYFVSSNYVYQNNKVFVPLTFYSREK